MIAIHMLDGRIITRAQVTVIDSEHEPVGLIREDSGYMRVHYVDGAWWEHPDWRYYQTIAAARAIDAQTEYMQAGRFVDVLNAQEGNHEH